MSSTNVFTTSPYSAGFNERKSLYKIKYDCCFDWFNIYIYTNKNTFGQ